VNVREEAADAVAKTMNVLHRAVLKISGGRWLNTAFGMPAVELHTTGRKSGQRRSVMLTTPVHDGDTYVVVASKGGDDRHPDWYGNLVAQPDVELTVDGVTKPMRAHAASPAERAELWPRVVEAYKGYGGYQERTQREIPLIVLEPR
jgi:deazaflavin-dependent oxidoreductase (nitroreductase family)